MTPVPIESIPVLVATGVVIAVGIIWFSPAFFGSRWEELGGARAEEGVSMGRYGLGAGLMFLWLVAIAHLLNIGDLGRSLSLGGVGLLLLVSLLPTLQVMLWERKPFASGVAVVGYLAVSLCVGVVVISLWPW